MKNSVIVFKDGTQFDSKYISKKDILTVAAGAIIGAAASIGCVLLKDKAYAAGVQDTKSMFDL